MSSSSSSLERGIDEYQDVSSGSEGSYESSESSTARPVHGSVRVGFVPNLEPTRPDRLVRNLTRRRPAWLIGSDLQRTAVGSVGVGDLKIGQNPTI